MSRTDMRCQQGLQRFSSKLIGRLRYERRLDNRSQLDPFQQRRRSLRRCTHPATMATEGAGPCLCRLFLRQLPSQRRKDQTDIVGKWRIGQLRFLFHAGLYLPPQRCFLPATTDVYCTTKPSTASNRKVSCPSHTTSRLFPSPTERLTNYANPITR